LESKLVKTIAGTGERSENPLAFNLDMRQQNLSSPVDIVYDKESSCFYVAMSGIHQIWKLDTINNTILPMSGDGVEACHDDSADLMKCTWAQPYGVSIGLGKDDKKELFVADSESSSIRAVNLTDLDSARTIVGGDGTSTNLFCYGDMDGESTNAKLQHPMGVHYVDPIQRVVVLDSYNHKVKLVDPKTNEI
jgi:DNA-binding beta-propeller fold protein YncE